MAEFQEVMKQAKRMCDEFRSQKHELCYDICTISLLCRLKNRSCVGNMNIDSELFEKIVMGWAEKNPGPRYPTWKEWQDTNFPNNDALMRPCIFESEEYFNCKQEIGCEKCVNKPIPADIAEKLGIKPIGETEDA